MKIIKIKKNYNVYKVDGWNNYFSMHSTLCHDEQLSGERLSIMFALKFELQKHLVTQEYSSLSSIMNVALRTDVRREDNETRSED